MWISDRVRVVIRRELREFGVALLDSISCAHCAGCGRELGEGDVGDDLCRACATLLDRRRGAAMCPRCGAAMLRVGSQCPAAARGRHDWLRGIDFARTPFGYAGTGGALVRRLKFRHDRAAARVLARSMARELDTWVGGAGRRACFVSVPLHRSRRRRRGMDQAALLASEVAGRLGRPFWPNALVRTRATLPQGDLRVTSRDRNVAGAFGVRGRVRRRFRAADVVLVDDVATSVATARECARVMKAAGANRVVLLTACGARH